MKKFKFGLIGIISAILLFSLTLANAQNPFGQTLQINTRFRHFQGRPTWILMIRDETSGQMLPYVFDIKNNDNFWVAFTFGHSYRVTASQLKFSESQSIHNFCGIEDGILTGQSMIITVTGYLTPDPRTTKCEVMKYLGNEFTIVPSSDSDN